MAHTNDLNAARKAVEDIEDPYDRATVYAEIAKASAFTDLAAAVEDIAYEYKRQIR